MSDIRIIPGAAGVYARCIANPSEFDTTTVGCINKYPVGESPGGSGDPSTRTRNDPLPSLDAVMEQAAQEQRASDAQAQRDYDAAIRPAIRIVAEELRTTGKKPDLFRFLRDTPLNGASAGRLTGVVVRDRTIYPDVSGLLFKELDTNRNEKLELSELGAKLTANEALRVDRSVRTDLPGMLAERDMQQNGGISLATWRSLLPDRWGW